MPAYDPLTSTGRDLNDEMLRFFAGVSAPPEGGVTIADLSVPAEQIAGLIADVGRGSVCFTWDDGYTDVLSVAAIHGERDQHFTIGVTNNLVGTANHIGASDLEALAAAGHELAAHSVTHTNFVSGLTAAQRAAELDASKAYCEARSGRPCTTWIYPFGGAARNATTDQELHGRFHRFLDVGSDTNQVTYDRRHQHFPPRHLVRFNLTGTAANQSLALEYIRQAAVSPVTVVFMCHQLDESGAPSTAQYIALADECRALAVPVVTVEGAFPLAPGLRDPGFEYADVATAWVKVLSGDGVAESVADTPFAGLPGSRSLHLSAGAGAFAYVTQPFPVQAGATYTMSGRYRTAAGVGGATLTFRARQFDYAAQAVGATLGGTLPESTAWARHTVDMVAHADAAYWLVDVLYLPGVAGEAWVDHLDLAPRLFGSYG